MNPSVVFSWPVRVYWEDTDAGGVVYHAAYLRFLERARSEWLRACGVDQSQVRAQHGLLFVVSDMHIAFHAPARLDDVLDVRIEAFTRRSASLRFTQCILRPADGAHLIQAQVRVACIDAVRFKPRRIPEFLRMESSPA